MGILNVTPDSFSDGGAYFDADAAIAAGFAMRDAGADIVDVGGESTRPGAQPVHPELEMRRVVPVIRALAESGVLVSVDTRNAATMRAALEAGARIVNDVSALTHDRDAAPFLAGQECAIVLMHMRGDPATMSRHARYENVAAEVAEELSQRIEAAVAAGIRRDRIAVDPGFGFAKRPPDSIALLRDLHRIAALGLPLVAGVSRKGFIGAMTGIADPASRDAASLAAGLFAVSKGAAVLRVHDVAATRQALSVWHALATTAN